ncbi:MAG TPA: UvrD-helicase domain-containing protein [Thermoanaerobaculia bacterium]|nr:UvrD-helicase domain-containing protein [Thermoanaerobaculia bacterium]
MTKRTEPPPGRLSDEDSRTAIREDLSTTILVEAAAGTGKTRALVERMVAAIATGRATMDRLAAVTFTIKAAAQLRQRFQNALEAALRGAMDAPTRQRLTDALARLDLCFVGTIHAFGARLLRERPVEAGIDPGFLEMDEPEDGVARGEAWERFTAGLFVRDDPRLARLMELGIDLRELEDAFATICENADVEVAAGPDGPEPDFTAARLQVEAFLERAARAIPAEAPQGGWTGFQEAVRSARRLSEIFDTGRARDFVRVLRVLRRGDARNHAGAFKSAVESLREDVVKPALARWAEHVHPAVMRVLADAREEYRLWRRAQARLNFQDLLLEARDLLRDHPEARRSLARRFTPILVDEFQDTDPIQAEILLLLTGAETDERDWRRLTPVPGSLFVVGDPKQSIYRFRRADIETYEDVRARIAGSGRILELTTNFRSSAPLCGWINRTFSALFPAEATREQARYVPLDPRAPKPGNDAPVFRLACPASGSAVRPVVAHDSRRIADHIAAAIARCERTPADFLVLFRRRTYMGDYARALEERGVPYEIAGTGAFKSLDLAAFLPLLQTLADPDDPIPFVAALRGPIFGVDDEALYRFTRIGGRFDARLDPPTGADPRIRRAFEHLHEGARLAETLPPAAAMSRFAGRLGWTAATAAEPLGDSRAGNLVKALAAARKLSAEGRDFPALVRELDRLRNEDLIEQMSLEPGRPSAVRLMTLHGAKGLEASVVFLAEPAAEFGDKVEHWIDRSVSPAQGHFRVVQKRGEHSFEEIARPAGWDAMEDREKRFEEAEKTRFHYVGATRARESLVVSVKRSGAGKTGGTWAALDARLPKDLPESPPAFPAPAAPASAAADLVAGSRARSTARRTESAAPSYQVAHVTALVHAEGGDGPARESTGRGMEWGHIIHRLLEAAMRDSSADLPAYARNLFAETDRPTADLDAALALVEAARRSPLWKRALAAKRRLVEVPFALVVPSAELGLPDPPRETLLTGAIDLLFEDAAGWTLVDYKSDRIAGNLDDLARWYAPQIRHYRRYWSKLTGRPTRAGLFFVETGEEVWLPESEG